MKAFVIRFLVVFCSLTVSVYCSSSSNLRLRDIDGTGQEILFRTKSISARHRDLIDIERRCNAQLKSGSTTNFVVGKMIIFNDDGSEREIPLHPPLSQGSNVSVFDSATQRVEINEALKEISGISFQDSMIDIDSVVAHTAHNFPAIPESKTFMDSRRNNMLDAIESRKTFEDASKECKEKRGKFISLIETGSKMVDNFRAECKQCDEKLVSSVKAYYFAISPLVISVWHSEPRVLALLSENLKPRSLLDSTIKPSVITLHLHSTNNVCDCCRLQLVGATYNWLYEAVICAFGKVTQTPKFHIIVTWFDEYNGSNLKNTVRDTEIKDVDFAAFDCAHPDTSTFSTPGKEFFLTLVKLDKAKFPPPEFVVGAVGEATTQ